MLLFDLVIVPYRQEIARFHPRAADSSLRPARESGLDLKAWHWILIGAMVGVASGAIFGMAYALAGAVIGLAGGAAMALAMR